MEKKEMSDYSDKELENILKSRRAVLILFIIIEAALAGFSVFKLLNKKFNYATDMMPIIFLPILINMWTEYKKLKNEVRKRKE